MIHPAIPYAQYHALPGLRSSFVRDLLRSPKHAMHEKTQTKAMLLGSALHTAILEPMEYLERYVPCPEYDARTNIGKAIRADLEARYPGKELLRANDAQHIAEMTMALNNNPLVSQLLKNLCNPELSLTWEMAGVACKCRIDGLTTYKSDRCAIDIKTCPNASMDEFARKIFKMGYHIQEAFYRHGLAANDLPIAHFFFVAVESTPPHDVAVYHLDPGALDAGENEISKALTIYKRCLSFNPPHWPGYPAVPQLIHCPIWMQNEVETEG